MTFTESIRRYLSKSGLACSTYILDVFIAIIPCLMEKGEDERVPNVLHIILQHSIGFITVLASLDERAEGRSQLGADLLLDILRVFPRTAAARQIAGAQQLSICAK